MHHILVHNDLLLTTKYIIKNMVLFLYREDVYILVLYPMVHSGHAQF